GRVFEVETIGAGILRDDQQFLDAGTDETFGFTENAGGWPAGEVTTDLRDDAEGAAVVAAFGNLEIGVVPRRQLQPAFGDEVHEPVGHGRQMRVYGRDHAFILVR